MKINVCQPARCGGIVQPNPAPRSRLSRQSCELDSFFRFTIRDQTAGDLQVCAGGEANGCARFNRQRGVLRNLQRSGDQDGFLRCPDGVALERTVNRLGWDGTVPNRDKLPLPFRTPVVE